jgi:hydroxypyruvate reductase
MTHMAPRSPLADVCEAIYREALADLSASRLVAASLAAGGLPDGPVRVLALGKAAAPMLDAALEALGPRARDPLCVLPEGSAPPAPGRGDVRVLEAGHPRATHASLEAGRAIVAWARAGAGAPALVLLSGGGSALAVAPAEGVPFEDKAAAVAALMRAGLSIHELNAVRKHLSLLKGGRLGLLLEPAPVLVLVLSDVPGDDLTAIASGPLVPDTTTFAGVEAIVAQSGAAPSLPAAVLAHLRAGARGEIPDTPKPGDPRFARIAHRLLAGPVELARAAGAAAARRGFAAEASPEPLRGDVAEVAARLGRWAREHAGHGRRILALGGEPTIRVPPDAARPDGGRAQHLALLAAGEIAGLRAAVLAAGSDGRDGPTGQAGAVVDGQTLAGAARSGVDLARALAEARSGPAAVALGAAIPRFETGTHLCDLHLVAVE